MKMNTLIIIQLILFSLYSCEKEENKNDFPIDFRFELLNEQGNASTTFKHDENFYFSFKMENKTNDKLFFNTNFVNDEFFMVYHIGQNGLEKIGKPYKNVFCLQVGGQNFLSPGINEFIIPWMPDSNFCCPPFCEIENNTPLSEGSYETKIDSKISVQNETKGINMEKTINFVIKFLILK